MNILKAGIGWTHQASRHFGGMRPAGGLGLDLGNQHLPGKTIDPSGPFIWNFSPKWDLQNPPWIQHESSAFPFSDWNPTGFSPFFEIVGRLFGRRDEHPKEGNHWAGHQTHPGATQWAALMALIDSTWWRKFSGRILEDDHKIYHVEIVYI